jgi:hypothetical protein
MSIFDSIKHAIFGDKGVLGTGIGASHPAPTAVPIAPNSPPPVNQVPQAAQPAPAPAAQSVDVEAILTQKAAAYGKPNNWQTSIVDLLTLLGMDSSLSARKELGQELGVHAGADGSAEQNIALHRAVMKQLAANGGHVPASLLD